jgi:hypothetical protein
MPMQVLEGGRGMMLSIFNLGTRRGRVVNREENLLPPPGFKTGPSSPLQVTSGIATTLLQCVLKKQGDGQVVGSSEQ